MDTAGEGLGTVLQRLLAAINAHDLDALVSCFADGYLNETPAHPQRGFGGNDQVRRNWAQIFAGVLDICASVPRSAAVDDTLWTEWELSGTRTDGGAFLLRGVVIFTVGGAQITAARFYLEPVEDTGGNVAAHTRRLLAARVGPTDPQRQS